MKHIEKMWSNYRIMVLPPNAGEVQISETKQAFFAGVCCLFTTMIVQLDPDDEPTESDLNMMSEIKQELDEWGAKFDSKLMTKQ